MSTWDEGLHPRDPKGVSTGGRFVTLRSKVEGSSVPMSMDDLAQRVAAPDGGFTYSMATGKEPRWGFSVSIRPDLSTPFDPKNLKFSEMSAFVQKNMALFSDKENYIGAWHHPETGEGFLDVSRVVGSAKEARRLSLKHDQIGFYVLHEGHSVIVDRNATSGGAAK